MSFDAQTPWTMGPPPPPPPPRRTGPMIAAVVVAVAVVAALVIGAAVFLRGDNDQAGDATQPTAAATVGPATPVLSAAAPAASEPASTVQAAPVAPVPVEPATVTVTAPPPVTITAPPPVIIAPAPATIVLPAPAPVYRTAYGDLGLSIPMTRPACDGLGIVLLFSSVSPGAYASEIQNALDSYPGSSYLRTDQACSSLTQTSDSGNPIYAVYRPAGYSASSVCAAVNSFGGSAYGKWLDNSSAADATVDC